MRPFARLILPVLALALSSASQTPFAWKDLGGDRMEPREHGGQALVDNYGPQLREGAPEGQRRCCYVFPVWTPAAPAPSTVTPSNPASRSRSRSWSASPTCDVEAVEHTGGNR
jgi:hypothetical protein